MRGFYEVEKKKPAKGRREETAADWAAAKKNDPRVTNAQAAKLAKKLAPKAKVIKVNLTPTAAEKVIAGLKGAIEKQLVGAKVKDLPKKVTPKKLRKLVDEVVEGLKALSKKRSRK